MKSTSICDDKLLMLIGSELSRIGMFIAVSELEQAAIAIYTKLGDAHEASGKRSFTLDCTTKDANYYTFMSCAIIVDILSRSRLPKVRDTYELDSIMSLLDKYLHQLSTVAGPIVFKAKTLFRDIDINIPGLPVTGIHVPPAPEDTAKSDHHLDAARYATEYPCKFNGNCAEAEKDEPKLCSNCEGDECFDTVNMTVEYGGVCYGFCVDPILLGLNQPIQECDVRVFKKYIKKGYELFMLKASKIFAELHTEYGED